MSKWPITALGDVARVSPERIEPRDYADRAFNYVGLEHIESHTGRLLDRPETPSADILSTKNVFRPGQILYGKLRPYLNKVHLAANEGICSTDIVVLNCDQKRIRPEFAAYYLRSDFVLAAVKNKMAGANLPRVDAKSLLSIPTPLPPLAEQERLVRLLDEAEALRRLRTQADERTNDVLAAIYDMQFGHPVSNPKRWPMRKLVDLCFPKQWPTISQEELTETGFPVYGANGRIGFYHSYNHEQPTVLITCRGATCGTINVCEPKSYVTGNSMALDDPDESAITLEFLEWTLRVRGMNDTITGAAQPQITRKNLEGVSIPTPPIGVQEAFGQQVAEIRALQAAQAASRKRLDDLFQSLLHCAFQEEL
ncbi:MAG: restriction endonuclease subunit S [Verrucomicrobia bacterium]|jgi:type I restriction enzyme S subunit|nr:restriction endonuclease subunit S [Verrucomicrobiota bacterium]